MKVLNTERVPIKYWDPNTEEGALQQARNIANLPFVRKWVSLMPDSHQGYGMPIGGVCATKGVIVPNMVGVDIGCGMAAVKTDLTSLSTDSLKKIMGRARDLVPTGFSHHKSAQDWELWDEAPETTIIQQELTSARKQLGTLGGGNHFIEFQVGSDGHVWVMVHSGSRNFGFKTAKVYHEKAQRLCEKWHVALPDKDLAFLPTETDEAQEYFTSMQYCLKFALANRSLMMNRILDAIHDEVCGDELDRVNINHNYAALEHHYGENVWVHRKGATRARVGERGIIPGSMGAESYIVAGKGNPESFHSCSHGAGRKMGRKQAQKTLDLAEETAKMEGIVHGLRNIEDLDEAPGSYKAISEVMANQADLVEILVTLKPLGNIKG